MSIFQKKNRTYTKKQESMVHTQENQKAVGTVKGPRSHIYLTPSSKKPL